jgi:hypothetical protein
MQATQSQEGLNFTLNQNQMLTLTEEKESNAGLSEVKEKEIAKIRAELQRKQYADKGFTFKPELNKKSLDMVKKKQEEETKSPRDWRLGSKMKERLLGISESHNSLRHGSKSRNRLDSEQEQPSESESFLDRGSDVQENLRLIAKSIGEKKSITPFEKLYRNSKTREAQLQQKKESVQRDRERKTSKECTFKPDLSLTRTNLDHSMSKQSRAKSSRSVRNPSHS